MKNAVKRILPPGMLNIYRRLQISRLRLSNNRRTTKDVFTRIYKEKKWAASSSSTFQSGSGSNDRMAEVYTDFVKQFLVEKEVKSLVDLGCGDYNVGKRLQQQDLTYIGVDIVDDLIKYNNQEYSNNRISFLCLNIIDDKLPEADLCLIRQVFQHLSNQQILAVLNKLDQYRYVLVSEHYPADHVSIIPNLDKPHGEDVRIYDNSAVCLDKPPFNVSNIRFVHQMQASTLVYEGEKIKTFLIENSRD